MPSEIDTRALSNPEKMHDGDEEYLRSEHAERGDIESHREDASRARRLIGARAAARRSSAALDSTSLSAARKRSSANSRNSSSAMRLLRDGANTWPEMAAAPSRSMAVSAARQTVTAAPSGESFCAACAAADPNPAVSASNTPHAVSNPAARERAASA